MRVVGEGVNAIVRVEEDDVSAFSRMSQSDQICRGKGGFGLRGREFQGCRRKSTRGVDPRLRGASNR